MSLSAVLIRQLTKNDEPVVTAVTTSAGAEECRLALGKSKEDFDVRNFMKLLLEDEQKVFISQFPEFKNANWYIQFSNII